MNILFIGDIVGRPARAAVKQVLPKLKKEKKIDLTIANGENLASGLGMTEKTYQEMMRAGIDYFTSGNHIWNKREFVPLLDEEKIKVLRPANYPQGIPGRGVAELKIPACANRKGKKVIIINLLGRVFTVEGLDNPFLKADEILSSLNSAGDKQIIIVDFHAEATSEKNCFAHYLDGRVSAVLGSHTHVQTNDARILPKGTAYLSDVGMVGGLNSSIGDDLKEYLKQFLTGIPGRVEPAGGPILFNAVLVKIDEKTGQAKDIELIKKIVE